MGFSCTWRADDGGWPGGGDWSEAVAGNLKASFEIPETGAVFKTAPVLIFNHNFAPLRLGVRL